MIQPKVTSLRCALLTTALALACSQRRPLLDARSGAPEYGGAAELPWPPPNASTAPPLADAPAAPPSLGPAPAPQEPPELTSDGLYVLRGAELQLTVDAQRGGRVVSFELAGKSALLEASSAPDGVATAFWPSPPGDWGGSVPAELDREPYGARVEGDALLLQSDASAALGLRFEKRYRLDRQRRAVEITYGIVNVGQQPRRVAPWEVQRMRANAGLLFFPTGQPSSTQSTLKLDARSPVTWFTFDANRQTAPVKAYADGHGGWLAQVSDDLVLVRAFTDSEPGARAPGEAEIEILADYDLTTKQHRYVEAGLQGPYVELAPGASSSWTVRWFLRRLPAGISIKAGNAELLGFVRGVVQ